ncbi:hypothetical protein BD324DRAFT_653352 [Kockovaella imperatae]|uniref:SET domain-containing protein n=1 Tax=Kockovaella imperatae TaxID=4999 RepID=A0A1Y1U974_9TREE|nr:hypothetical protein BD324DRAFT_653352 [Kockovaella imperatae]ORX34581.1 hypothetical protein BD324DRAFT_653352 [Kockovaella imperatae]
MDRVDLLDAVPPSLVPTVLSLPATRPVFLDDDIPLAFTTSKALTMSDVRWDTDVQAYRLRTQDYGFRWTVDALPAKILGEPDFGPDCPPFVLQVWWNIVCHVEKNRLFISSQGAWETGVDTILGFLNILIQVSAMPGHWMFKWLKVMQTAKDWYKQWLQRFRMLQPEKQMEEMKGGTERAKEDSMKYPMLGDILAREMPLKLHEDLFLTKDVRDAHFNFIGQQSQWDNAKFASDGKHIARRNLSERPGPIFPNGRQDVVSYYTSNPIVPHTPASGTNPVYFQVTFGESKLSSGSVDISSLKEIAIKDLNCPMKHKGRVLYCRVLTLPVVGRGIAFAVEDSYGHAIALAVDHPLPIPARCAPFERLKALYPRGAILAVKEPYVHYGLTSNIAEVQVAMITDVVELPCLPGPPWRYQALIEEPYGEVTVRAFKDRGNEAIKRGDTEAAIKQYSLGLLLADKGDADLKIMLLLNRALANLDIDRPGPALADCTEIERLSLQSTLSDAQCLKLVYRKFLALKSLRLWSSARGALADCVKHGLDPAKIKAHGEQLRDRDLERQGMPNHPGMFTFASMENSGRAIDTSNGDYVGPVAVRKIPNKGRGLVVTSNVKAGTLLFSETAAIRGGSSKQGVLSSISEVSGVRDRVDVGLAERAVEAFIADPSRILVMDALMPRPSRSSPILTDEQRLEVILAGPPPVDIQDTVRRVTVNSFGGSVEKGSLTFGLASMANHSCIESTVFHNQGETRFTYARFDLKAGDEVTYSYVDPSRSYSSRLTSFNVTWGFTCSCELCTADAKDDWKTREALMQRDWPTIKAMAEEVSTRSPGFGLPTDWRGSFVLNTAQVARSAEQRWAFFCDFVNKLEKTYAPGRKVVKSELIEVMSGSQYAIGFGPDHKGVFQTYEDLVKAWGGILGNKEYIRKTGRALKKIPDTGNVLEVCRFLLRYSTLLRTSDRTSKPLVALGLLGIQDSILWGFGHEDGRKAISRGAIDGTAW